MNNIVVIGSCNIDLTVLSDKRPVAGETVLGNGLNIAPGGKGANQAVAAAKLGANVTMVGCIGNDAYGQMVLENLHRWNINTDYLVTLDDVNTGTAHITLAEGDNSIIVLLGASFRLLLPAFAQHFALVEHAEMVVCHAITSGSSWWAPITVSKLISS